MKKQAGFRLSSEVLEGLRIEANKQKRSLNNLVEIILGEWLAKLDKKSRERGDRPE